MIFSSGPFSSAPFSAGAIQAMPGLGTMVRGVLNVGAGAAADFSGAAIDGEILRGWLILQAPNVGAQTSVLARRHGCGRMLSGAGASLTLKASYDPRSTLLMAAGGVFTPMAFGRLPGAFDYDATGEADISGHAQACATMAPTGSADMAMVGASGKASVASSGAAAAAEFSGVAHIPGAAALSSAAAAIFSGRRIIEDAPPSYAGIPSVSVQRTEQRWVVRG